MGGNNCYIYQSDANGTEYKIWNGTTTTAANSEMTSSEYKSQPSAIDPKRDGVTADCIIETTGTVTAWAVYSSVGTASTNACAF